MEGEGEVTDGEIIVAMVAALVLLTLITVFAGRSKKRGGYRRGSDSSDGPYNDGEAGLGGDGGGGD